MGGWVFVGLEEGKVKEEMEGKWCNGQFPFGASRGFFSVKKQNTSHTMNGQINKITKEINSKLVKNLLKSKGI